LYKPVLKIAFVYDQFMFIQTGLSEVVLYFVGTIF
jgi:hypothetical protein